MTQKEELERILNNINLEELIREYIISKKIENCFIKINFENPNALEFVLF
jgi:hypothetical protein